MSETNRPYREHHLLNILDDYEARKLPLDRCISDYFRDHKALGSKDRAYIAETLYGLMRWLLLVDHLCKPPQFWEQRLEIFNQQEFLNEAKTNPKIPLHIRLSFPEELWNLIVNSHGIETAEAICTASNFPAPTTVRANPIKISRDELLDRWKDQYSVSPCKHSPFGIVFHKKINFFALPEFKQGLFEVQDEGSQLLALMVDPKPKELVMDYCSGSGGKTLCFAPKMQNQGQIYLHDVRPFILEEGRKRLRRAGIQNAQVVQENDPKLKKLKKKMNWVLADVPCSGTGTLRRNPDMKWKFEAAALKRLVSQQRVIFEKALSYMHPEGHIVYGTCSLLKEENQEQVEHFIKTYQLEIVGSPWQSLPALNEMDGFFGVVMKKQNTLS